MLVVLGGTPVGRWDRVFRLCSGGICFPPRWASLSPLYARSNRNK